MTIVGKTMIYNVRRFWSTHLKRLSGFEFRKYCSESFICVLIRTGRVATHYWLQSPNYFSFPSTWLFQMKLNVGVEGAVSLLDVELFGLTNFCTFDKAFLCFWPFLWSASADFPLDNNSITLWQALHFAYPSLWIFKPTINKMFLVFWITHFFYINIL